MQETPFISPEEIKTALDAVYPHAVNLYNTLEEFESALRVKLGSSVSSTMDSLHDLIYELENVRE